VTVRPAPGVLKLLAEARSAEKAQALFYRGLAADAEDRGDAALAERLNGLHADEQHHLSRLTARLVELEQRLENLDDMSTPFRDLASWEHSARRREREEIGRYERLLGEQLDAKTRSMTLAFLEAERLHESELGGKWMGA
jgi:rubrerythrin